MNTHKHLPQREGAKIRGVSICTICTVPFLTLSANKVNGYVESIMALHTVMAACEMLSSSSASSEAWISSSLLSFPSVLRPSPAFLYSTASLYDAKRSSFLGQRNLLWSQDVMLRTQKKYPSMPPPISALGGLLGGLFKGADDGETTRQQYATTVAAVNAFEPTISSLSDDELREKTPQFKERASKGESLESILPVSLHLEIMFILDSYSMVCHMTTLHSCVFLVVCIETS